MGSLVVGLLLVGGASLAQATTGGVAVQEIRVTAIESQNAQIPLLFTNGQQVTGQIKGTLSVSQTVDVSDYEFVSVEDLRDQLQRYWCPSNFIPRGQIVFNAGRHLSAELGEGTLSSDAVVRIETSYRQWDRQGQRYRAERPLTVSCR